MRTLNWQATVNAAQVIAIYFICVVAVAVVALSSQPLHVQNYIAWLLGIISTVCGIVQFVPQIITTWYLKVDPSLYYYIDFF